MRKNKNSVKSQKPTQADTSRKQGDTNRIQSPMEMMQAAGFNEATDSDFAPSWDDIEKYIALMRIKYNGNEDY